MFFAGSLRMQNFYRMVGNIQGLKYSWAQSHWLIFLFSRVLITIKIIDYFHGL